MSPPFSEPPGPVLGLLGLDCGQPEGHWGRADSPASLSAAPGIQATSKNR